MCWFSGVIDSVLISRFMNHGYFLDSHCDPQKISYYLQVCYFQYRA